MESTSALKRFAAFCIDYLIIMMMSAIVAFLFIRLFDDSSNIIWSSTKTFLGTAANIISGHKMSNLAKLVKVFSFYLTHMKSGIIICSVVTFLYFIYFEQSKWQATVGKKLLGTKVKTITNKRLSLFKATKRMLLFATPALFFYFLVFFVYPQCLKVANMSFYLFQFKIEAPTSCINPFIGYILCYLIWFMSIFFTKEKATIYDTLSNTRVKG